MTFTVNLYRFNMTKPPTKNILVNVPIPLLKRLDAAARKDGRSRTKEVCVRLERSLTTPKPVKSEAAA